MFKLFKIVGAFILAVPLLVVMTFWMMALSFLTIVFEGMNKLYTKLVEIMIKTGEEL